MAALAFEVHGSPDGPPLICLPAFATTRQTAVAAFEPALATSDLRRIYLDLPGHGGSPVAAEATSEAVLAAVSAFVHAEARGPVLLVGWSYGAYLAAAISRRWPDTVRGLLLVCPGVRVSRRRDLPGPPTAPAEQGWLDGVPDDLADHLELALGRRTSRTAQRVSRLLVEQSAGDGDFRDRLHGAEFALGDEDSELVFPGPTTILTGRHDRVVGYADQYREMGRYPSGSFSVLDGTGHYLPFEQPDLLRVLALDWVHRCLNTPRASPAESDAGAPNPWSPT